MAKLTAVQRREKFKKEAQRQEAIRQKAELEKQKENLRKEAIENELSEIDSSFSIGALLDFVDIDKYFVNLSKLQDFDPNKSYDDLIAEYSNLGIILDGYIEDDEMYKKEMVSGFDIELNKRDILFHETQLKNYQTYIQSFIPKYNYYTCSCCGQPKRINKYYYNHSISNLGKIDGYGLQRSNMCIECSKKLFEFYFAKVHKKDSKKSMLNYCADTNTYWNEKVFNDTVKLIQSSQDSKHILDIYNEKLFSNHYGKTFFDSVLENDFGKSKSSKSKAGDENSQLETQDTASAAIESTFAGFGGNTEQMDKFVDFNGEVVYWPKEDVKNLKKVIKMIGYDPFYYIDDEGARKNLYADFLNILDTDMQFDFTKMQAAIQIVTGFWKIREFDKMYAKLRAENASTSELKNISDLKTKEMQTITKFTQDHGFAERYAASKAKGEGTLTGIMEKMNESQYEDVLINGYDIKTSESISKVADISISSIMKQLNINEAEVYQIAAEQLQKINELTKKNESLEEELRLSRYAAKEAELKLRAIEEGRGEDL